MKKRIFGIISSFAAALVFSMAAYGWGGYEHTIAAYAVQDHLSANTLRNLRRYLDQPIYEYAEWMDFAPLQKSEKYGPLMSGNYHCFLVMPPNWSAPERSPYQGGDGQGELRMNALLETLEHHRELPDSLVTLHLRCFIHLIGDMHCPAHIIYYDKADGDPDVFLNNLMWKRVYYEGKKDNVHSMWDSALWREHPERTFDEWARLLDNWPAEMQEEACRGAVRDWISGNAERCEVIYDWIVPGASYDSSWYSGKVAELAHYQICLTIYRMAKILNQYFDYE